MPVRWSAPGAALAIVAVCASAMQAQIVRGDVVDGDTQTPLFGAIVVLLDSSGQRLAGAISDDSGHFAIRAPAAGHFTLRADRIGYQSTTSPAFDLGDGATVQQRLRAPVVPVLLGEVTVKGDNRCVVRPQEGMESAALWTEARKALYATALALDDRMLEFTVLKYTRALDPFTMAVRHEHTEKSSGTSDRPFGTNRTPETLAREGYVQNDSLMAPDADVLLSDAFADTHCFRVKHDDDHAGLVGLEFEPIKKRKLPDVTGVLWLDQQTAELRFMEFRHTRLFADVSPKKYGGRVEFERLGNGAWIVRRWYIRAPMYTADPEIDRPPGDMRDFGGKDRVTGFWENGGEVISTVAVHHPPQTP